MADRQVLALAPCATQAATAAPIPVLAKVVPEQPPGRLAMAETVRLAMLAVAVPMVAGAEALTAAVMASTWGLAELGRMAVVQAARQPVAIIQPARRGRTVPSGGLMVAAAARVAAAHMVIAGQRACMAVAAGPGHRA